MYKKFIATAGLVGVGVLGRLVPHLPNATPLTAITLAAQKEVGRTAAFVTPLLAMILSDLGLGWYDLRIMASVYASFAAIAALSLLRRKFGGMFAASALAAASSVLFFITTNFAVWLFSPWYAKTLAGLVYCYTLGLPFFGYMLAGDLVYTAALLGGFSLLRVRTLKRAAALR